MIHRPFLVGAAAALGISTLGACSTTPSMAGVYRYQKDNHALKLLPNGSCQFDSDFPSSAGEGDFSGNADSLCSWTNSNGAVTVKHMPVGTSTLMGRLNEDGSLTLAAADGSDSRNLVRVK